MSTTEMPEASTPASDTIRSVVSLRPVSGDPEARAAEPCDEHCDLDCVHHTPSVGWDLSFGSRINFHPVDTTDGRMVVSLHLSDDAIANGMVYREVRPQQLVAFAQHLLALAGGAQRHACDRCGFAASLADVGLSWGVGVQAECRDAAACNERTRRAARLRAAVETVEWARNSGDGSVDLDDIDELTEAAK